MKNGADKLLVKMFTEIVLSGTIYKVNEAIMNTLPNIMIVILNVFHPGMKDIIFSNGNATLTVTKDRVGLTILCMMQIIQWLP